MASVVDVPGIVLRIGDHEHLYGVAQKFAKAIPTSIYSDDEKQVIAFSSVDNPAVRVKIQRPTSTRQNCMLTWKFDVQDEDLVSVARFHIES